jgi:S-adenosylmethionine-diacylglycerol 3-amino-3-carboxypropyl transferase
MNGGTRADYSMLRYAQCWEDADVLLDALQVRAGDTCVSIASGGDNTLALLSRAPGRVIAIDTSPAQLACLELRVAAYRELCYGDVLCLFGARADGDRRALYARCRSLLSDDARRFWDARPLDIARGIGESGKFESYFRMFRTYILPLVHERLRVETLFARKTEEQRTAFYNDIWNNRRWRTMFRLFFSRTVMARLGRHPAFFRYVTGSVAGRISERARYAMTALDPAENPYLQWIFFGTHTTALPYSLRPENFDAIRSALDRLEWRRQTLAEFLQSCKPGSIDRFNLSDIFEYMAPVEYEHDLELVLDAAAPGARMVYWNMLVPRSRPDRLSDRVRPLTDIAQKLHARDKAFFYSTLVIEEVTGR